jgi:hypothetical protein
MLSWLHQIAKKNRPRAAERPEGARLRGQIERLEDRAMLSATIGPMHGHDAGGFAIHSFVEPQMAAAGMYAASPRDQMSGPAIGGMHHQPRMMGEPGYGSSSSHYQSGFVQDSPNVSQGTSWVQFPTSLLPARPQMTYYIVFVSRETPTFVGEVSHGSTSSAHAPPKSSSILAPPLDVPKSSTARSPSSTSADLPRGTNLLSSNAISPTAAALSIPTAAQIVSRDVDSAVLISSSTVDAAIQSYVSRLLLTTRSVGDYPIDKSWDTAAAPRDEAAGDLIRLADFTLVDDEISSREAIKRERAAVDEVLSQLEDLDTLPTDPAGEMTSEDEAAAVVTFEDVDGESIAESEGGMVILEASGDANGSDFNLAEVADNHLDLLNVRVGVEAAVGFYQAVDVAADEEPAPVEMPSASPVIEPAQRDERDDRVSTDGEKSSSPKAAAAIGATLAGALLWASQRPRTNDSDRANSKSEQRRRASCRSLER